MGLDAPVCRIGRFTYLDRGTQTSLRRNGKVYTQRDGSGSDDEWVGVTADTRQIEVQNARTYSGTQRHTLDANGFELLGRPLADQDVDFLKNDSVVLSYYPQVEDVIRQACGARLVAAFDHNVRSVVGNRSKRQIEGGQQVQPPLHMVHGDYTMTSAPQRLRDLAKPPTRNDTFRSKLDEGETLLDPTEVEQAITKGRFAIVNLWRNIASEPVLTHPLALCDAARVSPDDLVVFEIHYADRIGENYYAKHSENHRWFFYPEMTRDEALLIKQWDSDGELSRSDGKRPDSARPDGASTFSFHSAFVDPSVPDDAPDRWSIETRCVVLY
ncbi:MAG: CmcJ/NvfI family oxidoreductase [Sedimentitalea sp.]|uniref:CmcJ/NvfI family oxidoreductase n=1 Tax=Sedimentitalea sp. TaxID=2048915 RepID=UPI003264B0F9